MISPNYGGNITNRTLDNATSSAYTIDQLNRQSAIQHNLVGGAKRFDYAFNSVSDITAVQRDSALGDGFTYDLTQQIVGFQQNGAVNLAAGTVSAPATTNPMLFDGCGNRTSLNGVVQTFDNLNRLTPTAGITYNNNSVLTAWNSWACTYDAQNRLTGAINGATTLSFFYDAKNRQIARSINGAITFSVWDDWELVEEYTTGNVRTGAYLQGAHGPIKSLLNNIYFYQDSLGSTSHLASATGALLEYYKYDLNGKPTFWSPPPLNTQLSASNYGVRDLFTGERFISEMGMYDLRNRFYSPELGRFLQPDPIGFKGDASNLYRYCGNDWANMTDPLGLQAGHQSSDDKCTNAFNLPDWLYKDMRGLNSSQPAGITIAQISAEPEGAKAGQQQTGRFYIPSRVGIASTKGEANPTDYGYSKEYKMQVLTKSGEPLAVPGMKVRETLTTLHKESNIKADFDPVRTNPVDRKGMFKDSIGLGQPPPKGLNLHTIRDQHYQVYFPRDGQWHPVSTVLRQEVKFQNSVREIINLSVIHE